MKKPKILSYIFAIAMVVSIMLLTTGCIPKKKSTKRDEVDKVEKTEIEEEETERAEIDEAEEKKQEENVEIEDIELDKIEEKIKLMTLEEKIGQLIIAGFEGEEISNYTRRLINDKKIGGFILFTRNIKNEEGTLKLLNDLKLENSSNDIPLFLSIDEEGGNISRLPNSYRKIPVAIKFGNKNNSEILYKLGQNLGNRVKSLGFNIDYAPVLDIHSNKENTVIGSRAYGTTVESVVKNGIEVMEGIRSTNVIPVVKHFPGHGDTSMDSHIALPKVNKTLDELKSLELIPFKKAIEEKVEMIMIAHILYPKIDELYPSSMSSKMIQELLRDEMGYQGVVVSDDMTMGAILENYSLEDGVLQFIKSGGDLVLVCHGEGNPALVIDKIIDAVNKGEISEEEIDEKVYRLINLKEKYKMQDNTIKTIDLEKINNETENIIKKLLAED